MLIDLWPGYSEDRLYGLAIDLGSTTIAAHLCDASSDVERLRELEYSVKMQRKRVELLMMQLQAA